MIGAEDLAAAAEQLEKAAKDENGLWIDNHHAEMMEKYRITVEAVEQVTGTVGTDESEEILEFPPMDEAES